jgi:hypothetical protein
MALSPKRGAEQARKRIEHIRAALPEFDLVCSGTLVRRMIKCGKPNCRCASDKDARHGPYWQWGHMRAGKPTHRFVSEQQALVLRQAIDNYRQIKKLLNAWEENTERIVDALQPPKP